MAPIWLTVLPMDTATARRLAAANNPDAGTVAITVRPDTRRPGWLARDLLSAIGVRHDVTGTARRDSDDRLLAAVWLDAYDIEDLLVIGVESLQPALVDELVDLTSLAGTTLWLVADHTLPQRLTDTLVDWPMAPCPPAAFTDHWLTPGNHDADTRAVARDDGHPSKAADLPATVPQADFTTFRAACQRLLDPDSFAPVDAHYLQQLTDSGAALDAGTEVLEVLRAAVERTCSAAETTVAVRAVQAAAFVRGVHVKVDLASLLARDDHVPAAAARAPATWSALRAYRHPHRQAVCMLTLFGLTPTELGEATLDGLDTSLEQLTVGPSTWPIPAEARPAMAALRTTRAAVGADGTDWLLADLDGTAVPERTVARIVATVPRELGVRVDVGQVERTRPTASLWARRRAIRVTHLEG